MNKKSFSFKNSTLFTIIETLLSYFNILHAMFTCVITPFECVKLMMTPYSKTFSDPQSHKETSIYSVITSSIVHRLLRPTLWNAALIRAVLKGFSQMQWVQVEPGNICLLCW